MSNEVAGAVVIGGLGLLGAIVIGSSIASARQTTTTQTSIPTPSPREREVQTYTFPDGITEAKIVFYEGARFVESAEIEVTPTLENGGSPSPSDIGYLYIIIREPGKLPELYQWSDGSTHKPVSAGTHYELDLPINKYIDLMILRIRKRGVVTKMNDTVIVLTKK